VGLCINKTTVNGIIPSTDNDSQKDPRFGKGDSAWTLEEGTLLMRSRVKALVVVWGKK